jgi:allantoinase
MNTNSWILKSRRVVTPEGTRPASVVIRGNSIADVTSHDAEIDSLEVVNVGDRVVMPGLVDIHVHINEPGRTEWEGFWTATRAAACGGVTTLVDMPLNSMPAVTSSEALQAKRDACVRKLWVDCGFHGGVVPGNASQIGPLAASGVLGFKAFLCPSGVVDFPGVSETDLRAAATAILGTGRALLVHAEISGLVDEPARDDDPRSYAAYLATRPPRWELEAIRMLIGLCREYRFPVHIVHLATAQALPMIARAKADGLPLTVETCPHYLTFAAESIPDGDPRFKCAPPIRLEQDREGLWEGLASGLIDTIGSDHSPAPAELKHLDSGDLIRAWGGIASLQIALPVVWTGARRRGFLPEQVVRWMAENPANLVGLGQKKGKIAPGFDADLVVFYPDASFVVDPAALQHRHPATPYAGRTLFGRVERTYRGGKLVQAHGSFSGEPLGREIVESIQITAYPNLTKLNNLPDGYDAFLGCCGSTRWARMMSSLRPFASPSDLIEAANRVWIGLSPEDQDEAFAAHPRIGDVDALRARFTEQAGVIGAADEVLDALATSNSEYEARFGRIFLVCATGKTAGEMLNLLRERMGNDLEPERTIAVAEQAKITRIRLGKLWS